MNGTSPEVREGSHSVIRRCLFGVRFARNRTWQRAPADPASNGPPPPGTLSAVSGADPIDTRAGFAAMLERVGARSCVRVHLAGPRRGQGGVWRRVAAITSARGYSALMTAYSVHHLLVSESSTTEQFTSEPRT